MIVRPKYLTAVTITGNEAISFLGRSRFPVLSFNGVQASTELELTNAYMRLAQARGVARLGLSGLKAFNEERRRRVP